MTVLNDDCYAMQDWETIIHNYLCKIEKEYQDKIKKVDLLLTGISDVDYKLDIQNGEVIVVLSELWGNKNGFVTDCIFSVANRFIEENQTNNGNKCILYFDFEHSANNIAQRIICQKEQFFQTY